MFIYIVAKDFLLLYSYTMKVLTEGFPIMTKVVIYLYQFHYFQKLFSLLFLALI